MAGEGIACVHSIRRCVLDKGLAGNAKTQHVTWWLHSLGVKRDSATGCLLCRLLGEPPEPREDAKIHRYIGKPVKEPV